MPIEDVVWGTSSNNTHIGFSKLAGSHHSSVPMDIDNVKIWYYEDGATEPTYITDDNFEGAGDYIGTPHSTAGRENNFFAVSGAGGHTHACYVALSSENDYEKIGAQGGEASITYTFDLTPGLYTVSGEARLDYYNPGGEQAEYAMNGHPLGSTVYGGGHHLTYVAAEDNMAELTISVEAGSKTYASSTEIYTEWDSAGGLSFKVPEGSDSNEVKITFTMNDTTSAANMALDLRALSLSSLGALTECELGEDMLTLANASSTAEITAVEGGDKYNQYLHLYNRKYSAANSGIGFCSVTQFKANTLYYIKLDARVALPTVSAEDGFAAENVEIRQAAGAMFEVKDIVSEDSDGDAYNSYYLTPTDKVDTDAGYTFKASENEAETVWNENGFYEVVLNEDWTTLEFAFVPTVTATRRETGLALFTSGDYSNAVPIDIDNVEIFYYASGSTEPTYVDSFDFERGIIDIDYVMSTDILGHFYVANGTSTKNANSSGVISVEQEKGYDRISLGNTKGAVVNYDFGGMTLEPGVYALDGIMRQDYNNPGGTDAQTAYSAGAHSTYMEGEDNRYC